MKTLFTEAQRRAIHKARFNLDVIKAEIMANDPATFSEYGEYELSGSLKDRIEEIVYNHAYETASSNRAPDVTRRALDALFALAKREKFLPAIEKAWRNGLTDGGA